MRSIIAFAICVLTVSPASAKVLDISSLTSRERLDLVIYKPADTTLVREILTLPVEKGDNQIQFSWPGLAIDPTSISLEVLQAPGQVTIAGASFSPDFPQTIFWKIESPRAGTVPFALSYLLSGLSWTTRYEGILEGNRLNMTGWHEISNSTDRSWENAYISLVSGKPSFLVPLRETADRPPYVPDAESPPSSVQPTADEKSLSGFSVTSLEGTFAIPSKGLVRTPIFAIPGIPVDFRYRFAPMENTLIRFFVLANDAAHSLGTSPLTEGTAFVLAKDQQGKTSFFYSGDFPYLPVGGEAAFGRPSTELITAQSRQIGYQTTDFIMDWKDDIDSWNEVRTYQTDLLNRGDKEIVVEVVFILEDSSVEIKSEGDYGEEKRTSDTRVLYILPLPPGERKTFQTSIISHRSLPPPPPTP